MTTNSNNARRRKPNRTDELQALVGRGELAIVDMKGVAHPLSLLNLSDLADWEKKHGQGAVIVGNMEAILYLLWLGLRGEGKTEDEKDRGEWAYTEPGVGRLFTAVQLQGAVEKLMEVMVASGWLPPEALEGKAESGTDNLSDPSNDTGAKQPSSSDVTPELASANSEG